MRSNIDRSELRSVDTPFFKEYIERMYSHVANEQSDSPQREIIDRFLEQTDLRIVASEGDIESVECEAQEESNSEFVSEQLARIYEDQELYTQAIEIYRALSLQKSEKSVYFAHQIARLEKINAEKG